jgi:hypothetical protein
LELKVYDNGVPTITLRLAGYVAVVHCPEFLMTRK